MRQFRSRHFTQGHMWSCRGLKIGPGRVPCVTYGRVGVTCSGVLRPGSVVSASSNKDGRQNRSSKSSPFALSPIEALNSPRLAPSNADRRIMNSFWGRPRRTRTCRFVEHFGWEYHASNVSTFLLMFLWVSCRNVPSGLTPFSQHCISQILKENDNTTKSLSSSTVIHLARARVTQLHAERAMTMQGAPSLEDLSFRSRLVSNVVCGYTTVNIYSRGLGGVWLRAFVYGPTLQFSTSHVVSTKQAV